MTAPIPSARDIAKELDRCVMCGLCVPGCPTYGLSHNESESPRGRISLMSGLWQDRLAANPTLVSHLDSCLECRHCEAVCPAGVRFGLTMDATRARIEPDRTRNPRTRRLRKFGLNLVTQPKRLRLVAAALRIYQRSGLQALARRSGLLRRLGLAALEQRLPPLHKPWHPEAEYRAAAPHPRGRVGLFTGCLGPTLDSHALDAAVRLLQAGGYDVCVPRDQTCCGALHLHNGAPEAAKRLAQQNAAAFAGTGSECITGVISGCTSMLGEYAQFGAEPPLPPVRDIATLLLERGIAQGLRYAPLRARVAVHTPCSLRNVLKQPNAAAQLLQLIPNIELVAVGTSGCCGAAGSYLLSHPENATALRERLLDEIDRAAPDLFVTSNIGCAIFIQEGLRTRGRTIEVVHPATLIERQRLR